MRGEKVRIMTVRDVMREVVLLQRENDIVVLCLEISLVYIAIHTSVAEIQMSLGQQNFQKPISIPSTAQKKNSETHIPYSGATNRARNPRTNICIYL